MDKATLSGKLTLSPIKRPQDQIADYLREEISSGNLKPGALLPTTHELAAQWQTHATTVQRAIGPLAKEGFLVRRPGVGTFIREREKKLTCVGVYGSANIKNSPYTHAVRDALSKELHEAGIETELWLDPRTADQQAEPWKPLFKAAEQRRFQALIASDSGLLLHPWQAKMPVPIAFLGNGPSFSNSVDNDVEQFVKISLQELARQGCRSVGLIAPLLNPEYIRQPELGSGPDLFNMLECFIDVAGELGLIVKNDWMRVFQKQQHSPPEAVREQEQFGYDEFLKLWSQPEKPEGLLICHDVIARGAVMAIREKQVRVPDELKLVLCKNEGIDLFCPMPATFAVSSERDIARALIEQVQKQFRGESCERILLPFKLVPHTNP